MNSKLDLKLDKTMKRLIDCGEGNHKYVNKINSYGQPYSICKVCHDRREGYVGGDLGGASGYSSGSSIGTMSHGYQSGGSIPLSTKGQATLS